MDNIKTRAQAVREHAEYIRNNPNSAQAVADALDVIADALDGKTCEDCASDQAQAVQVSQDDMNAGA